MQTGLHQWLLKNPAGWLLFDMLFYTVPIIYLLSLQSFKKLSTVIVICMIVINFCYIQCYTLYPINSIEGHIAWIFFPLIFLFNNEKTFALLYEGLRYFFLFFFASAGVWKIVQGGVFNLSEMSGVLLYQHNQLLTNSPGYWQTDFILWLINNPTLSYLLYLLATLLELSFIIGFFTKRYDRLLAIAFVAFLIMDYVIMRIPYFEVSAFLLTLIVRPDQKKM